MDAAATPLARLADPDLPAVGDLLGAPAGVLGAAVEAAGGRLLSARPRQTAWAPGRQLTVRYDARVRWPDGERAELLVATTGRVPDGALVLEAGGRQVGVWRVPHDPWLPGLAAACDAAPLGALLDDLGASGGHLEHRLVAYRPGRRAVVRVRRGRTTLFLKVVRPGRAAALHERHAALRPHVPVPQSLGYDDGAGLVVLQALGGSLLRTALTSGVPLPSAGRVLALLDRLPGGGGEVALGWRSAEFAALLGRVCPALAPRLDDLAGRLAEAERRLDGEPLVPVHGDLHEAQLLVDRGAVCGVLDVDGFGTGRRTHDLANLVGHLSTLALRSPKRGAVERYAASLLAAFDRAVDPAALRAAVADAVLGLATGPFRVLQDGWERHTEERVALAERWLASAGRVAERDLTAASPPPHLATAP